MRNRHFVPSSIINTIRLREKIRDQRLAALEAAWSQFPDLSPEEKQQASSDWSKPQDNTPPNPVVIEAVGQLMDKHPVADIRPIELASNIDVVAEPIFEFTKDAVQQTKL